ncbi:hypothetical protein J6TS2_22420 [Heyndrickxia sporothermodurans]|nr:hypothetical protein J6TS2_22420 [Heyndrickxia sporothermodurans]
MKKNTIPYVALTAVHIILLIFTMIKRKDKKLFGLLFTSIGFAYLFEIIILNLFRSYRYYPKIFKNKWLDTIFGAIVSQAFLVPISATTIAFLRLGWKWIGGITLFYTLTERLFIYKRWFKNNWWHTYYTTLLIPAYFYIMKKWMFLMERKRYQWVGYTNVFFFIWVNYINIYFVLVAVFKKFIFGKRKIIGKYRVHFLIEPPYLILQSMILLIAVIKQKYFIGIGINHLLDQLLYRYRWIQAKRWTVYCFLPIHVIIYLIGKAFNKQMEAV